MNGSPGPLIKWFLDAMKVEGIAGLVSKHEDKGAVARTIVGYTDGVKTLFFEGEVRGRIVSPRGENGFGWDKMFLPDGSDKTFGEMERSEKEKFSMRKIALVKLGGYLEGEMERG